MDKDKVLHKIFIVVLGTAAVVASILVLGFLAQVGIGYFRAALSNQSYKVDASLLLYPPTWLVGFCILLIIGLFYFISYFDRTNIGNKLYRGKGTGDVQSVLENSRFMTEKECNQNFEPFTYEMASNVKNDGVPMRAYIDKKGKLQCNFMSGVHSLIIGATGSGKTTTFINPMIQLLGAAKKGSSMIMTDPKGELLDMHSEFLVKQGYKVRVLDLRDTYSSSRWNPLGTIWDMYQEYVNAGKGMRAHRDNIADYPDLKIVDDAEIPAGELWIEYKGKAYGDPRQCQEEALVAKQKIYDEVYEDLSDLISVLCPITNDKDPLWEKGARSIVLAVCLAMLEDSENPELGMTKDKFNFYNVNKILANSDNDYEALKAYFDGRSRFSQAVTLSRQVLSAAKETMSSYMSITYDKLTLFNDRGICGLTSANDIDVTEIATTPTAIFLKIPDEKDTRHGLASMFVLCVYKALIKVASGNKDLSLERNVYFILDEFGNMPKIEKFDKMITVGRSRKIWFNMVVQSYAQLNNVYGEQVADIVKSNCAMKMFIGSNDIGTCKEFSELCGNKTVKTVSTSGSSMGKNGEANISTQTQVRPLIYPSELQKLNNKQSTGNAIIVTFGNYPLMTKYTPSYKCSYYKFGKMDMEDVKNHIFRVEEVTYDVEERNKKIVG